MKTTLFFKRVDFFGQVFILLISLYFVANGHTPMSLYYTVGAVQVISCIVNHSSFDQFLQAESRSRYEHILLLFIYFSALSLLISSISILVRIVLLLGGPVLAVWYASISLFEMRRMSSFVARKEFV